MCVLRCAVCPPRSSPDFSGGEQLVVYRPTAKCYTLFRQFTSPPSRPEGPGGSRGTSCLAQRVSQCHGCDRAQRGHPQQHPLRAHSRVSQNSGVICESHTRRTPSTRLASAEVQLALRLCTILCNITLPYAPMVGFSAHEHVLGVAGHQCGRPPMRFPPPHEQSS